MLFSSMVFLWIFLPVVIVGSRILPKRWVNPFLVLASLFFYAWGEPINVLLMLLSILINWGAGLLLQNEKRRKLIVVLDIVVNLILLCWFKYLGLLADGVNQILGIFGLSSINVPQVVLPIGISFFTFQALSYVVDVYRKEVEPQKSLINVALYISFFPQLIAGPIVRYQEINEQIESRQITLEKIVLGIRRFAYGLGKKILLSNVFAKVADAIYLLDPSSMGGGLAWLAAILYTLQIYYDFSGYSDMAIGLGKMFGFDFSENFKYPYISKSIQEFWRRWHISLSTWFREYLYIPLGGNRKGTARTYTNLLIVFFCTGIWHGASISFILWGLYHGIFSIIERLGLKKILDKVKPLALIYTLFVVIIGWVLFRVEDVHLAIQIIGNMMMPWANVGSHGIWEFIDYHTIVMMITGVIGAGVIQQIGVRCKLAERWKGSLVETIYLAGVLVLCIASLASNTYNPFIYFRF